MAHSVRTNFPLTQLPLGGGSQTQRVEAVDTTVLLTDEEFARLPSNIFTNGTLDDLGDVGHDGDHVTTQAAMVAAPAALTSVAITGGESPTEAEHNALLVDLAALRTTVANLLVALKGSGKPMSST
jgi:hypothetical protein